MSRSLSSWTELSRTEKRMLLAELLREKAQQEALFPLSYGQRGFWFLSQLDQASAACNIFFPARIRSHIDVPAFRRALQTLIARHPSLRTTFEQHGGEPYQRVHSPFADAACRLEIHDASGWSEEALHARVAEEAYRPFDLGGSPLARLHLFSRSPEDHIFLLTAHHIIGDFWSLVVLMEEMQQLYPAACAGESCLLPPPAAHYRDFVRWQAEMLASSEGERLLSYWEKQLTGVTPVLDLPTDRPRPRRFRARGAAVPCHIEPSLAQRLRALAAAEGVTLYTVLLAAFQVLLSRHTGQEDFVVGSPFAGRSRPEFERVVGCFINLLPLRAQLSGDPTIRELLHQTSATVLEALQHQDYPFSLLVERLGLPHDPSRPSLVQVSFTLEKAHRPVGLGCWSFFLPHAEVRLNFGGLPAEPYCLEQRACQMDLEMILEEGDNALYGIIRYNTDLFDEQTIVRLAGRYHILLKSILEDQQKRISELSLLTPAEQRCLLHEWNDTAVDYPRDVCLHQLFEQQAARSPQAVALRYRLGDTDGVSVPKGEERCAVGSVQGIVRYGELEAWANRLARLLQQWGVGPDVRVALCLERSPAMIAAMLGVLKAGGAYVPLDPASPLERLRSILIDIRPAVLLTQRWLAKRLPDLKMQVFCVEELAASDQNGRTPSAATFQTETRPPHPNDLAYVIYTSGSTGQPKGVMIEHRAICNTICWHQHALTMYPQDRVLLLIPYVFDASVAIIFSALAGGAELVLAEPGTERDPVRILEYIRRNGVTVLPLPPSLLRLMLDERLGEAGRTLRWICCGGEAMPPDLPARLFEQLDVPLYNLYGPTETAVDATWWTCRRGDQRCNIPIGRPIANVQVYVLDHRRQLVPIGVPGELYIGGAGLARGYWNDPLLTAERFVSNPFGNAAEARLYRTGDRCRWLADGNLEFLGRVDHQVKLRGYRIELGEIEALLTGHPAVQEAAVVLYTKDSENPRLVAYITARASGASIPSVGLPTAEVLRRYLQERLPEYMIPSAFVLLPSMPRTPSGKVDRKALPPPLAQRPDHHPFVAPRTPLEEYLAGLWGEFLFIKKVGILDNFFALGGSSLQAAALVGRVQEKLGRQIYTVALFDAPTIAGLAQYLIALCPDAIRAQFGEESLSADSHTAAVKEQPSLSSLASHGRQAVAVREQPSSSLAYDRRLDSLLVALQPNGVRPACFLVHPPGGIVVCYQALAQHLGDERPFYGIRSRGLYGETDLPTSLEEMAADYVAAIRTVQPQGPYHLGGWSMGGVIAYEMAQQLRLQGQSIGLLALLDTTIPYNTANAPYAEETALSAREYGLDLTLEELERLGPEEQLPYLWDHVRKLGLIDDETPWPLVQQIINDLKRLFHTHIKLGNRYALRPYPGRLTLFRPQDAPVPVQTALDRNWGKLAAAVDVYFVPGQHHTMVKEPHVQVLAQQLRLCLRQADSV